MQKAFIRDTPNFQEEPWFLRDRFSSCSHYSLTCSVPQPSCRCSEFLLPDASSILSPGAQHRADSSQPEASSDWKTKMINEKTPSLNLLSAVLFFCPSKHPVSSVFCCTKNFCWTHKRSCMQITHACYMCILGNKCTLCTFISQIMLLNIQGVLQLLNFFNLKNFFCVAFLETRYNAKWHLVSLSPVSQVHSFSLSSDSQFISSFWISASVKECEVDACGFAIQKQC